MIVTPIRLSLTSRFRSCSLRPISLGSPHLRYTSSISTSTVDAHCVPTQATWSVNGLLASLSQPSISPEKLERIHVLSALIPPTSETVEHQKLTEGLESLVKLVEAVKLVDAKDVEGSGHHVPDGRVWPDDIGIDLSQGLPCDTNVDGRELLKHAAWTANGLYVVEADKHRSSGQ